MKGMFKRKFTKTLLLNLLLFTLVGVTPNFVFALGETYIVPKEIPYTSYTKCYNWAVPRPQYYSTTRWAGKEGRCLNNTCGKGCLKKKPDGTYLGTATAVFKNLRPGKYELWIHYRISDNRTSAFPWKIITDGTSGRTTASGIINQYGNVGCCGDYYLMRTTRKHPLTIKSTATLVAGSDTDNYPGYDRRSTAYGGAKLVRIGNADPEPKETNIVGVNFLLLGQTATTPTIQ